ncbi:MAG: hypothetical protein HOV81_36635 [Kofleriaceae bacterium]|nr:hypothetical protein [Kofleriaceae bacterium]
MRLASFALVATLAACHRAPGPTAPPANKAEPPAAELLAKDPLAFLPRDAELFLDLDLAKLKASPLWRSQIEPSLVGILGSRLSTLREMCGVDFLDATTRFTTGMKKVGDHYSGIMVVRGPDTAATMTCIETKAASSAKVTRDRDALLVSTDAKNSMAIAAVGPSTLVVATDIGATRATVSDAIAAGTPLRSSPAFMALYEGVEPSASLVTIANGASPMFEPMRSFGVAPKWAVLTATIDATYVVAARLTMSDADSASRIAGMIQGNVASLKSMVERLDVRAEGELVRIDVVVTEAQAKTILGLLGGAF